MPLKAAFVEVDITPPLGTHKIGWLKCDRRGQGAGPADGQGGGLLECDGTRIAFVQVDVQCFVDAPDVAEMHRRIGRGSACRRRQRDVRGHARPRRPGRDGTAATCGATGPTPRA